jgi:hypothetical protein
MQTQIFSTAKQQAIGKGKIIVSVLILGTILAEILADILELRLRGTLPLPSIFRFLFTLVLCVQLYLGKGWARAWLAFSFSLGTLLGLYDVWLAVHSPETTFFGLLLLLSMVSFYIISTYCLLFSSSVKEFLAYHRLRV